MSGDGGGGRYVDPSKQRSTRLRLQKERNEELTKVHGLGTKGVSRGSTPSRLTTPPGSDAYWSGILQDVTTQVSRLTEVVLDLGTQVGAQQAQVLALQQQLIKLASITTIKKES